MASGSITGAHDPLDVTEYTLEEMAAIVKEAEKRAPTPWCMPTKGHHPARRSGNNMKLIMKDGKIFKNTLQ